jgi:hypothetical protein
VKIVIDDLPNAFGELERDNSLHDLFSAEICPRYFGYDAPAQGRLRGIGFQDIKAPAHDRAIKYIRFSSE